MSGAGPVLAARLTPAGRGAVATIAVKGPYATRLLATQFRPVAGSPLATLPSGRIVFGHWGSSSGEEVVACACGPDHWELHCHGGPVVVEMILDTLARHGCRVVEWVEFLRSSMPNSFRREALLALPGALTGRTAAVLLDQCEGALQDALTNVLALVRAADLVAVSEQLRGILAHAAVGRHLTRPWRVVLAGQPNVGKSSLINALLGYRRSIVFDAPGTTRDIVRTATALDGWPVELTDTAGLRDTAAEFEVRQPHTDHSGALLVTEEKRRQDAQETRQSGLDDELETAGIRLTRNKLAAADLVVLVFDASGPWTHENTRLMETYPATLPLLNKCDLCPAGETSQPAMLRTSAVTGSGLARLADEIAARLVPRPPRSGAAVPLTQSQINAVGQVLESITHAKPRQAIKQLGELIG